MTAVPKKSAASALTPSALARIIVATATSVMLVNVVRRLPIRSSTPRR